MPSDLLEGIKCAPNEATSAAPTPSIDWGVDLDLGGGSSIEVTIPQGGISWDLLGDGGGGGGGGGGINWDVGALGLATGGEGDAQVEVPAGGISWDIDLSDALPNDSIPNGDDIGISGAAHLPVEYE